VNDLSAAACRPVHHAFERAGAQWFPFYATSQGALFAAFADQFLAGRGLLSRFQSLVGTNYCVPN